MRRPEGSDWLDRDSYRKRVLAFEEDIGSDGNLLQVVEIEPGDHVEPHRHHETEEVFYILQPGGTLVIEGEELRPDAGDVIICEPGDVHEVFNDTDGVFRILVFKVNLAEDDTEWL